MIVCKGKAAFGGIAIGEIQVYQHAQRKWVYYKVTDLEAEIARFEKARKQAQDEIMELYHRAVETVGEHEAAIFEVHHMMLDDSDYIQSILTIMVEQSVNAEYAVSIAGERYAQIFEAMDDDYMRERAADLRDISNRVIDALQGNSSGVVVANQPVILLARDLAPSETVLLDKENILSIVTVEGSINSHTAILARTMNIPALVKTDLVLDESLQGKLAIVNGFDNVIYIDPTPEVLEEEKKKKQKEDEDRSNLFSSLIGKENITLDGTKVEIVANIGHLKDIPFVHEYDAAGVGLFRSEFIYLEAKESPTEEQQFEIYKTAAMQMNGKKLIIRTLDLGADKQASYLNLEKEENPALGFRAIRICLTDTELFKTQLRAIWRASVYGNISVMYPMITSIKEVRKIKEIVSEVEAELKATNSPFKENIEQGIMIETPAAVMISDLLAKEVDFFSIGTNDLSQYAMAIDRQNANLDDFFDPYHPAILRMIKMTIDNAHANGIWVGICGELGADKRVLPALLMMGVDELSVSAGRILRIRRRIREMNLNDYDLNQFLMEV